MPSALRALLGALVTLVAASPLPAHAQATVPPGFMDEGLAAGLSMPTGLAFIPDTGSAAGRRLLFIEQESARVGLILDGALAPQATLGLVPSVRTGFERGLLGVAVDPRWPTEPYIYMSYSSTSGFMRVSRFTLTGDVGFTLDGALALDTGSRHDVLTDIPDNAFNHNGGTLRFGADSMLYASFGDDAVPCAAQDTASLRGVVLRLDVRGLAPGPGGPPAKSSLVPADNPWAAHPSVQQRLVWVFGLRNPFRFHIDPVTGLLAVGDVGEATWEELSLFEGGDSGGWPFYEAFSPFTTCAGRAADGHRLPVYAFNHGEGSSVISVGFVRRGEVTGYPFPAEFEGDVLVADYYAGFIRRLSWSSPQPQAAEGMVGPTLLPFASGCDQIADAVFGADGGLYYVRQAQDFQPGTGQVRVIRHIADLGAPDPAAPATLALAPPRPNPARGGVRLEYTLPRASDVELTVHDAQGRLVRRWQGGVHAAGTHSWRWDGRDASGRAVAAGVYLARLSAGGQVRTARLAMLP